MRYVASVCALLLATCSALAQDEGREPLAHRHVYVPAEELDHLLELHDHEGVVMELEDYRSLRAAARRSPEAPRAPSEAAVARATYRGEVEGAGLVMRGEIEVEVWVDEWVRLPLGLSGAAISKVEGDDVLAFLLGPNHEDSRHHLLVRGRGRHTVRIECALAISSAAGDRRVAIDLPRAVSGEFQLEMAGAQEVHATPPIASVETVGEGDATSTQVSMAVGGLTRLELAWHLALQGTRSPVLTATTTQTLHVARDIARLEAAVDTVVYHAPVRELELAVPAGLDVFSVESQELAAWSIVEDGGERRLSVRFRAPFQGARSVQIVGETALPEGDSVTLVCPVLYPLGVLGAPGSLAVVADSRLQVSVAAVPPAVRRVSPGELAIAPAAGVLAVAGFRYGSRTVGPTLAVSQEEARLEAGIASLLELEEGRMVLSYDFELTARGGPGFAFDVIVPADWVVDEVTSSRADYDYELLPQDGGATRVRGRLDSALAQESSFSVHVKAQSQPTDWRDEWRSRAVSFPMPGLPDVDLVGGVYGVLAEAIFDLREERVSSLVPLDLATLRAVLGGADSGFGYRLRGEDPALELEVRRKPTRVDLLSTLLFAPEDETLVRARASLRWNFAGGGARDLVLTLPAGTGEAVRFVAAGIAEKVLTVDPATRRDQWKITLQDRIVGPFELVLEWDIRRPEAGGPFELGDVAGVSAGGMPLRRELGWIVVEAGDEVEVTAEATGLEAIAFGELPELGSVSPTKMVVEQYRFHTHDWLLTLEVERHDPVDLLGGFAHRARVDTWLDAGGMARTHVDVMLQSNAAQFFELALPARSALWSASVNDQPVQPSRSGAEGSSILVPIARSAHALQRVHVAFEHPFAPMGARGSLRLGAPAFAVPVLESRWSVHAPRDFELLESQGDYYPQHPMTGPPHVVELLIAIREFLRAPFSRVHWQQLSEDRAPADSEVQAHTAVADARPSRRKTGVRSLIVPMPTVGGRGHEFMRLGAGGEVDVRYRRDEREPLSYWLTAVLALILGSVAVRHAGRTRASVILTLVFASGLLPYLVGGSVLAAANGLFGAALIMTAAGLWRWVESHVRPEPRLAARRQMRAASPAAVAIVCIVAGLVLVPALGAQTKGVGAAGAHADPAAADQPVFILYDAADGLPGMGPQPPEGVRGGGGKVFVPDPVFHELYRRAKEGSAADDTASDPGMVWVFEDVRYDLRLDEAGAAVLGEASFGLQVFSDDWFDLRFGLADVEVRGATLDGQPAAVRLEHGSLAVAIKGAGQHRITVSFATRVEGNRRVGGTGFAVCVSPLALLSFDPGRAGLEVSVPGSQSSTRLGEHGVLFHLGNLGRVELAWQPREDDDADSVLHVASREHWLLEPAGVSAVILADYSVGRGAVSVVGWELPAGFEVTALEGQGIRDWSVRNEGEARVLEVLWAQPVRDHASLEIRLRGSARAAAGAGAGSGEVVVEQIAQVRPRAVSRDTGSIQIHVDPALDVEVSRQGGVSREARSGQVDGWPGARTAFGFVRRPFTLELAARPARASVTAAISARFAPRDRDIPVAQQIRLSIAEAPLYSLDLELPVGMRLTQLRPPAGARIVPVASEEGGGERVRLVFQPPLLTSGVIEVYGLLGSGVGEFDPATPQRFGLVRLPPGTTVSGDIQVTAVDDREPRATREVGLTSVEAAGLTPQFSPFSGRPMLGYVFRRAEGVELDVASVTLEPHVEVHVLTDVFARTEFVDLRYALSVSVDPRRGGVDSFSFELPVDVVDVDLVTTPPVRYVEQAVVSTAAGPRKRWTMHFQSKLRAPFGLELALPREYDEGGRVRIPGLHPLGAALVGGHLVVENASDGKIEAGEVVGLKPITAGSVPGLEATRSPQLTFRAPEPGACELELVLSRFERREEVAAVIEKLELLSLVARDGSAQHQAIMLVRNRDRQFLEFELPGNAQLWSVFVAGQAVRPVVARDGGTMVRIKKTGAGARSYPVEIVYHTPADQVLGSRGTMRALAPTVRDIDVAYTVWRLDLPKGYRFSSHGGGLEAVDESTLHAEEARRLEREGQHLLRVSQDVTRSTDTNTQALRSLQENSLELMDACTLVQGTNPYLAGAAPQEGSASFLAVIKGTKSFVPGDEQLREDASFVQRLMGQFGQSAAQQGVALDKTIERAKKQSLSLGSSLAAGRNFVEAGKGGVFQAGEQNFYEANEDAVTFDADLEATGTVRGFLSLQAGSDLAEADGDGRADRQALGDRENAEPEAEKSIQEDLGRLASRVRERRKGLADLVDGRVDGGESEEQEWGLAFGRAAPQQGQDAVKDELKRSNERNQQILEGLKQQQARFGQLAEATKESSAPRTIPIGGLDGVPQPQAPPALRPVEARASARARSPARRSAGTRNTGASMDVLEVELDPQADEGGFGMEPPADEFGGGAVFSELSASHPPAGSAMDWAGAAFLPGGGGGGGVSFDTGIAMIAGDELGLRSLAVPLLRAPEGERVTSSFRRQGAAGSLEIGYVSDGSATGMEALGLTAAALLALLSLALTMQSLGRAASVRGFLGMGIVLGGIVLVIGGGNFHGVPVTAIGVLATACGAAVARLGR